jgi:hypothetical protein
MTNQPADPAGDCSLAPIPDPQTGTIRVQGHASFALGSGPHVRAAKVLALAQHMANKITSQAHAEVQEILNQADSTVQQLLAKAKAQAVLDAARVDAAGHRRMSWGQPGGACWSGGFTKAANAA